MPTDYLNNPFKRPDGYQVIHQIVGAETRALGELVDGKLRAAQASLDEAAQLVDDLLAGEGRMRLRYRPKAVAECIHIVLEMIGHQLDALQQIHGGDEEAGRRRVHGHASALWRISAYLHDVTSDPAGAAVVLLDEPRLRAGDEVRQGLVEMLDHLLEGPAQQLVVRLSTAPAPVRFLRRGDGLMLDFPIAELDENERYKALTFFQRLERHVGGWDEVSLSDDDFSFMLELGINLDRAAFIALELFREVQGCRVFDDLNCRLL